MVLVGAALETLDAQDAATKLAWLLGHPTLVAAADAFKASPAIEIKQSGTPRFVCVLQKEFATATPEFVDFVGTDDATTCVGVGIRDPKSGLTSIGHLDFAGCVKEGLAQMLSSLFPDKDTILEVHMAGAYDDSIDMELREDEMGHSWPLCLELVEELQALPYKLEIRTLCILRHNTVTSDGGYPCPAVRGFAIETKSGRCVPASFSADASGPDEIIRALSMLAGPASRLRSPYDTESDTFSIKPFQWSRGWKMLAAQSLALSDAELLQTRSTSPHAESPSFVTSIRRMDAYIYNHPDWEHAFPNRESRRFVRDPGTGRWMRAEDPNSKRVASTAKALW
ncbi:protein N-terminal asparagine amidohydrolase [Selaginella moellendorffii]|uniref:protein N-terminal asparagine amidohydrolase n=1 Tax=Selaginella moellendorffii TaxID=88036 RepID=UPI000D1CDE1B|nr:protein N-terminal asparagine amidohydrolase [Selaginella moellendorffii]|eukprot:XP_024522812.1 protein N-terminal asparagine amidohydrolase [Selaginella moellendorffii]